MNEKDSELEQLKAKRLREMQKNLSEKQSADAPSPREIVVKKLGYRGLEILENAEYQFPKETAMIVPKLAELIQTGDITDTIDGGNLLQLFRSLGIDVYVKTTINVEQDGKFVALSDKLKIKDSD